MSTVNRNIQSFPAALAVQGYLLVAAAAGGERAVQTASGPTDKILGVSERVGASVGAMLDVTVGGETEVRAGEDLDFDDPVTADETGRAVKAVPVAGQTVRYVGFVRDAAAEGDIVRIHVAPGFLPDAA